MKIPHSTVQIYLCPLTETAVNPFGSRSKVASSNNRRRFSPTIFSLKVRSQDYLSLSTRLSVFLMINHLSRFVKREIFYLCIRRQEQAPALRFNKRQIDRKGFQKGIRPFCRLGRFGNPIERVSDGSFPHFCPHRNGVPARHERKYLYVLKYQKKPPKIGGFNKAYCHALR